MKKFIVISVLALSLGACANQYDDRLAGGALVGGAGGALAGGLISGNAGGAVIGGLAGATVGVLVADSTGRRYRRYSRCHYSEAYGGTVCRH